LEYVLPCKYCRASFHDYIRLQPLTLEIVESREAFSRWVYGIHNRVNGKLLGQGLLTASNPGWKRIDERYKRLHGELCVSSPLLGWNFLTSVAYTTPGSDYRPTPMPDAPEDEDEWVRLTFAERNRYNLLTREERIRVLAEWWSLFPAILPCGAWRAAWEGAVRGGEGAVRGGEGAVRGGGVGQPPLHEGRAAMIHWMWRVEESVCAGLRCPTPHPSLVKLREEVGAYESGCAKSKSGKTCRAKRPSVATSKRATSKRPSVATHKRATSKRPLGVTSKHLTARRG
jgi:hypothetical protein